MGNGLRQLVVLSGVTVKRRKFWLISAFTLALSSLGVSQPALALCSPQAPGSYGNVTVNTTCDAASTYAGISYSTTQAPITVTLQPGVQVVVPAGGAALAVNLDSLSGASFGTGGPGTLIANNAAINNTSNPNTSFLSALFVHAGGNATITASGLINVAGAANTNAVFANTSLNAPGAVASVIYTGSATPGIIDINVTGTRNSTIIQACANNGCGLASNFTGDAKIDAAGNLKGTASSNLPFLTTGIIGLDAVAGGDGGNATVIYRRGTIDVSGSDSAGIFASGGSGATITTLPGTSIIVSSLELPEVGIDAFADNGNAKATVASTIQINGPSAVPTTNYKINPTGIRAQSDMSGDASVIYTDPTGITVHGGGALGIVAVAGSPDATTQSGRVTVNASGPINTTDSSNAVGILADSGFIRNVFSSGGRTPTTKTLSVDVTASNVFALGQFGTAISATGGSGGVTVTTGGSIMGGWQPDVTSVGVTYGLPAAGVVLGSVGGGTATLTNNGSVGALSDRAVASPLPSFFANPTSSFPTSNNTSITNNGTITGFVQLVGGNNSIINNGLFDLRHFADTNGDGVRDTLRVAIADLGDGLNNSFTNNGLLALPAVTGATTLDNTGQYLPLGNPNNAMGLNGPLQGHLIGVQTFTNSGTIDLQSNAAAGDVLVITGARQAGVAGPGTYISNGGTLKLDTVLNEGGGATRSDTLVVDGTLVGGGGATNMAIRNAGGGGALTVGDGILVVQVQTPTRSVDGAFSLVGHSITAGAFDYFLFKGGFSQGSQGNWYLRSELAPTPEPEPTPPGLPPPVPGAPPKPLFDPEVPLKSVVPSVARTLGLIALGTFNERQGDQLLVRGDPNTWVGAWGRVFGQGTREHFAQGARPDFDGTFAGFQAGADLLRWESSNGHSDRIGFSVAYARASVDVNGLVDAFEGAPAGHVDLDATSFGGYWTHLGPTNWYIDAVLQGTYFQTSANSIRGVANNFSGGGFAASIEGGYPIPLMSWLTFEPQIQGIWQRTSFDDTLDPFSTISFDRSDVFTGRVGALLRGTFGGPGAVWQPYLKGNVWWGSNGFDTVTFDGVGIQTGRNGGTALEGGGGVTGKLARNVSVYGDASYLSSVSGESRSTIRGNVGVRVTW
jgi:outer membrane autotransporter protein